MARTRENLKTKSDGSYYTVVDFSVAGVYPRVGLRTKNKQQALRRLTALETTSDTEEAKRRVALIADARDPEEERQRIAEILRGDMFRPAVELPHAKAELESLTGDDVDDRTARRWQVASSIDEQAAILRELGFDDPTILNLLDGIKPKGGSKLNPDWARKFPTKRHEQLGAWLGIDPEKFKDREASVNTLADCVVIFEDVKMRVDKIKPLSMKAEVNAFKAFVAHVGDKPVNRLTRMDVIGYRNHLKTTQGNRDNSWFKKQFEPIGRVLRCVRENVEWADEIPEGLDVWMKTPRRMKAYKPAASNKRKMPVDVFKALLATCERLGTMDIDQYAASLPLDPERNPTKSLASNKAKAIEAKRDGMMYAAILRLMANAGLGNEDICSLTWDNCKLKAKVPHLDFPRGKTEASVGAATPRFCPLLPATIKALNEWRDFEPLYTKTVFRNQEKRALLNDVVSEGFARIRTATPEAKDWTARYLRKVGPSLGKAANLSQDERQAFLGHEENGTNAFYEEAVSDPTYLVPLVNLIGRDYFDGEQISG